ncbi:hypothetical protein GCM10027020_30610 [Nocardioides salsibiostraticola]
MSQALDEFAYLGPQMIFGLDPQGRCTFSVGSGLGALGLEPGQLVGADLFAFYAEYPTVVRDLRKATSGETFSSQATVNGRLLRTSFQPVHGADGTLESSVGVTTDLTEHRRALEDLSRFRALADDSPDYVAIADTEGQIVYVNPRIAALGLSLSAPDLRSTLVELVTEERADELVNRLANGERWSEDLDVHPPTGDAIVRAQIFPLHDTEGVRRLGAGWIAQDITELRESAATLQEANHGLKQFRALVEASSDFIAIAGMDARIRYLNPAARALAGVPPEVDVSTTVISDYLTPEGVEQSERVEQPAVMEHGRWTGESTLRRADGSAIPVEIVSFLVPDPETGDPLALATVQRDITERRTAEAVQEDFVALVAHELRTPLASVKGYVEIVTESLAVHPDTAESRDHLDVVSRNILRIERLVEQILRVAGEKRMPPGERQPRDLVSMVEQAVESARPAVETAGLLFELETCPPIVMTLDETLVEVVDNLVSNAVKYTPAGGQISVSVARDEDVAVLTVTDTGPGISPSERDSIFEKFVRGDLVQHQTIPGFGLGLFITRAIVESHQGEISVFDRPGGGTRFVVRLPLTTSDPAT